MTSVYEDIGRDYNANRRADPRVVQQLLRLLALPPGSRVSDIGAGTGNYSRALVEAGYRVVAVEPSRRMQAQSAPLEGLDWLRGAAQAVPLANGSVDGVVSTMTLQHFRPLIGVAAREMRRMLRDGPAVLLVVDPREAFPFWFADYFPEIRSRMFDTYAPLAEIEGHFAAANLGCFEVVPFPLPADFTDLNMHSGWNRPEIYLDPVARQNMSPFALAAPREVEEGLQRLRKALQSGEWDTANGHLRETESFDLGFRFIRASLPEPVFTSTGRE